MGYLIDANVLSELRKPKRAEQVAAWLRATPPAELYTSVLVMAELRRGSQSVRRRDPPARTVWMVGFRIYGRDLAIACLS